MKSFIVGGGSGLGFEIVKAALKENSSVGYSTSADMSPFSEEQNIALRVLGCDLTDQVSLNGLIEKIVTFSPDRLIICSIHTRFQMLADTKYEQIFKELNFNIITLITIAAAYAKAKPDGNIVFILSHICFLYNPGFTLYKVGKDAVDSFAKSIQLEYPLLNVLRVYPGAMKTNFAAKTHYKGVLLFQPKDPAFWATRILKKKHGFLISPLDCLFLLLTRLLPFWVQKKLFLVISRLLKRS